MLDQAKKDGYLFGARDTHAEATESIFWKGLTGMRGQGISKLGNGEGKVENGLLLYVVLTEYSVRCTAKPP
jgi:hypothetical protein